MIVEKKFQLTESKIDEMCEVIVNCDLRGEKLVEYVKEFIEEFTNGPKYYCQCDNPNCGSWFNVSKIGVACKECKVGTMQPQDVEPY